MRSLSAIDLAYFTSFYNNNIILLLKRPNNI